MARRPATPEELLHARVRPRGALELKELAYRVYVAVLVFPIPLVLGEQAVGALAGLLDVELPLTDPSAPGLVAAALTLGSVLALAGVLQTVTWRGPFVLDRADVAWLLTSPLPRAAVLRPRLLGGLIRSAALAAAAGAIVGALAAEALGGHLFAGAAIAAVGAAALGLTGQAAAVWVIGSRRRAQRVLRGAGIAVLVLVALAVVLVAAPGVARLLAWSGPWGWPAAAVAGVVQGRGADAAIGLGLGVVAAAAAVWWAWRKVGSPPFEELARCAGAATGARAAGYLLDVAGLAEVRREAIDELRRPPRLRPPLPRRPGAVIPWRDVTALLRSPGRTVLGLLLTTAAGVVAVAAGHQAALAGPADPATAAIDPALARALGLAGAAAVLVQAGTASLCTPLRSAIARPFGHAHLWWSHARLVRRHLAVPTVAGLLAVVVGGVVGGALLGAEPGAAVLGVVLLPPALVAYTAWRVLQPPPPVAANALDFSSDTAAMVRIARAWPRPVLLAVTVLAVTSAAPSATPLLPRAAFALCLPLLAVAVAWRQVGRTPPAWGR